MSDIKLESGDFDPAAPPYPAKTAKEIRELALGVYSGTIFGSWMIHESDKTLLTSIFLGLSFLEDLDRAQLISSGIVHFYGNIQSDSFPRSINGYPMFHRFSMLSETDSKLLTKALDALKDFMDNDENATD